MTYLTSQMARTVLNGNGGSFGMKPGRILLAPDAAAGGGAAVAEGPGPEDFNLSDPAFDRLGLGKEFRDMPLANGPTAKAESGKRKAETEKPKPAVADAPAQTAEEIAAAEEAQAQTALEERATAAGVTAEAQAAAEQAETDRVEALATEQGKTVAEIIAAEKAAAAANQPPEFAPEQEAYVTALAEEKDAEIAEFRTKAEQAEAQVTRLTAELEQAKRPALAVMRIPPIMLASTPQEIEQHDAQLANFENWALEHWDGSEAVEARGDQPAVPAYTPAQIRRQYAVVKEQRAKIVPQARLALQERIQNETATKAVYPALFDSKRPESGVIKAMLGNNPELAVVIPRFHLVAGDAIFGETIRQMLANPKHASHAQATAFLNSVPALKQLIVIPKATGAAAPAAARGKLPVLKGKGTPGKAPRAGGGGGGGSQRPAGKGGGTVSAAQLSSLREKGLSERDALLEMISGAKIPTVEK